MKTRYEPNETTIDVIERLETEIERLRAENVELKKWIEAVGGLRRPLEQS